MEEEVETPIPHVYLACCLIRGDITCPMEPVWKLGGITADGRLQALWLGREEMRDLALVLLRESWRG